MDFNLSEEHLMIREAARDFAKQELLPGVVERDNKQEFPENTPKPLLPFRKKNLLSYALDMAQDN